MFIFQRWLIRRLKIKQFSIYLLFTLTIYLFLCLNQFDLKGESSLPWKQQPQLPQIQQSKRSIKIKNFNDAFEEETFYFNFDQNVDEKLAKSYSQIDKHLFQLESKLINKLDAKDQKERTTLIKKRNINDMNSIQLKLLKENGYLIVNNTNVLDWSFFLDLEMENNFEKIIDKHNCYKLSFTNNLDNLKTLFFNKAYFCAAFSVIYKEIKELNKDSKITTNCYVLPEQITEFEDVAIALGKNVNWLVKNAKETKIPLIKKKLDKNLMTNQIMINTIWKENINKHSKTKLKKKSISSSKNNTNVLNNNLIKNHFDKINDDSMHFAIEIIDSLSGKVFHSDHHSNDVLNSINFQNFQLKKLNNSLVYIQKPIKEKIKTKPQNILSLAKKNQEQTNKLQTNKTKEQNTFLLRLFTQQGKLFLEKFENQDFSKDRNELKFLVVEKEIADLIKIKNKTISIRQYVLITNLNPLRAYIYKDGLVFFMKNTTQFEPELGFVNFNSLNSLLEQNFENFSSISLQNNLIRIISKLLLISEFHLISNFKFLERFQFFDEPYLNDLNEKLFVNKKLCTLKQYQLLEIELVLTNKFELYVTNVNLEAKIFDNQQIPQIDFNKLNKKKFNIFQKNLLTSVWQLVGVLQPDWNKKKSWKHLKSNYDEKKHLKRSVSAKIKNLPKKYIKVLQKHSLNTRRKLLFSSFNKQKITNKLQNNAFRKALVKFLVNENIGIMGLNCLVSHQLCLTENDLIHIISVNLELVNSNNNFLKLYPSSAMFELNDLVESLNSKLLSSFSDPTKSSHRTADLHIFLCKLEKKMYKFKILENENSEYKKHEIENELVNNISKDFQMNKKNSKMIKNLTTHNNQFKNLEKTNLNENLTENLIENINDNLSEDFTESLTENSTENLFYLNQLKKTENEIKENKLGLDFDLSCSLDSKDLLSINNLKIDPNIKLKLKSKTYFSAEYFGFASFDLIKIRFIVNSKHCDSRIKFNQLTTSFLNVSVNLGIGVNRISFHVFNKLEEKNSERNYIFFIKRFSLEEVNYYEKSSSSQLICQINQNCNFKLYETKECGLKKIKDSKKYKIDGKILPTSSLKQCQGFEQGRWLINCNDCSNLLTCNPASQIWSPYNCTYENYDQKQLQSCFTNKNILFIGDSTNRGIMHYLIEKSNGTLNVFEKTHNFKIYSYFENQSFIFGFAYYPQFWKTKNMPSLTWTITKLMKMLEGINSNDTTRETVIIIGGVHWLSSKLILKANKLIESYKNTRLIIKSLGSGFHQLIDNVHYLPINHQRKFINHNQKLIDISKQKNIQILDTYNLTNFLYNFFYPGKCSCHFYKVIKTVNNTYQVIGFINKLYSQMMANLICLK